MTLGMVQQLTEVHLDDESWTTAGFEIISVYSLYPPGVVEM